MMDGVPSKVNVLLAESVQSCVNVLLAESVQILGQCSFYGWCPILVDFPIVPWKVSNPVSQHQNCKRIGLVQLLIMIS